MTSLFQNIREKAKTDTYRSFKNVPSCDGHFSSGRGASIQPAGREWNVLEEFVRRRFHLPCQGKVVNIFRETYKCPECAISEEHPDDPDICQSPIREPLIPESYASNPLSDGQGNTRSTKMACRLNRREKKWKQLWNCPIKAGLRLLTGSFTVPKLSPSCL